MNQAEIRRIFYGDEREPGTGKNPFAVKDRKRARQLVIEQAEKQAALDAENQPGIFDDIVQNAVKKARERFYNGE